MFVLNQYVLGIMLIFWLLWIILMFMVICCRMFLVLGFCVFVGYVSGCCQRGEVMWDCYSRWVSITFFGF